MFNTLFKKTFEDLSGVQFKQQFENTPNAVLLDVRTPSEFRSGNIPGAINMDIMDYAFHDQLAGLDKDKTYFVYCRSGNRSAQACMMLSDMGIKAINLSGGIGAWPFN